jgi:hypothetical protein
MRKWVAESVQFMTRSAVISIRAVAWTVKYCVRREHLEQQQASRSQDGRMETRATGLDEQSPDHCKLWRADRQEQDVLLRVMGQRHYEFAHQSESHGADAVRTQRHFPVFR